MVPKRGRGGENKGWSVPSEIGKALEGIGGFFSAATATRADAQPASSGPGPELDTPVGRHAGLEGWLAGGGGSVHDGAVGDHEGGSVPGAGDAGGAPLNHHPALMPGPTGMGATG